MGTLRQNETRMARHCPLEKNDDAMAAINASSHHGIGPPARDPEFQATQL